jgi:TP901 family phage tail tape measure protein
MKAVAGSVPASFDDAGIAISKFNSKLGLTGDPLREMSAQILELSRMTETDLGGNIEAVSKVMQNFGVDAGDQSGKLDLLFRASQASGVSVAELAGTMGGAGIVLRQVGLGFEESAGFIATLSKAGLDASDAMPSLAKAMKTAADQGKDAGSVFKDTFAAIKNAKDPIDAARIGMEVFGAKGGTKFAAMIREGKVSYEEMTAAISGGNESILKAGVETQDFGEKWTMIKNRIFIALQPIASKVFDSISQGMDRMGPIVDDVIGAFTALFAAFKAGNGDVTSSGLAGAFERIGNVAREAFDIAAGAIQLVKDNLEIVVPIVGTLGTAFLLYKTYLIATATATKVAAAATAAFNAVMAVNPITLIVIAIALLVAGIIMLYRNWDKVWNWIKEHKALAGVIAVMFPILIPIFAIVAAIKFLAANWEAIWKAIQAATGVVVAITVAYFKAIIAYIMFMWNNFQILWDVVQNVWSGILAAINGAWTVIQVIWSAIQFGIGIIIAYYQLLWQVVQIVWSGIMAAIDAAWVVIQVIWAAIQTGIGVLVAYYQFLWSVVQTVFGAIVGAVQSAWGFMSGVFASIKNGIGGVASFISEKVEAVVGFFLGIAGRLAGVGSAIASAIGDAFKGAWNFIAGIINDLIPDQVGFSVGPTIDLPDNPVPTFYNGGMVQDGLFTVGERGPELGMKQGSSLRIFSNSQSQKMLADASGSAMGGGRGMTGGGSVYNITINMPPGSNGADVVDSIKRYERTNGTGWRN